MTRHATPDPLAWLADPPCRKIGPDPFFTPTGRDRYGRFTWSPEAVAACRGCPVIDSCLADDLAHPGERHGYRSGMGPEQRAKFLDARRVAS